MKQLLKMLTYQRPAGSKREQKFIETFISKHNPAVVAGNQVIIIPGDEETLFSCHTDTVHKKDDHQEVIFDKDLELAYKDDKQPLGADDTAGVWLLLQMIEAGIPGTYVFHYGEERGCIGSKAMADGYSTWLKKFKRAIAFDRRGTTSIITHQMGERTCSAEFGQALADQLGMGYQMDDTGLYTDTASYRYIIPECTNVSVGYDHEHGPNECLDIGHLIMLSELVQTVKWSELPTKRNPDEVDPDWDVPKWMRKSPEPEPMAQAEVKALITAACDDAFDYEAALDLCKLEPQVAAAYLSAFVIREQDLLDGMPVEVEFESHMDMADITAIGKGIHDAG